MSLEEKAQKIREICLKIRDKTSEITDLTNVILTKINVGTDQIEFSPTDKQKAIVAYQTKKSELTQLYQQLP